ncbi:MAG TPA: hypothetical protein VEY69_00655 [Lautropia sp.]|nr:hypothetical protein [Lautropia sp.]
MSLVLIAGAALLALMLGATALLKGWMDWLALRRLQLQAGHGAPDEVRHLRSRVRKLERIALGLD